MNYFIKKTVILFVFILSAMILPAEEEIRYYSFIKIISTLKVDYSEESLTGKIIIKKNNRSVTIIADGLYLLINDKPNFIGDFIIRAEGDLWLPLTAAELIIKYFTPESSVQAILEQCHCLEKKSLSDQKDKSKENLSQDFFLDVVKNDPKKNNKTEIEADQTEDVFKNDLSADDWTDTTNLHEKYIFKEEPKSLKINAIIIDPGHGGTDPGAIGFSGTKEKDITLKVALVLADRFKQQFPDKKIILTRDHDIFIPLEKRSAIANWVFNKYGASLFISIHVNASRSSRSYGYETWYLVEEYRRNIIKSGQVSSDREVEKVLNSMLNDEIYKESKDLAQRIQNNLTRQIGKQSLDRGIKEQTYFVIKKSVMPAVLVEIGFNTNYSEEIRLTKSDYLTKITLGIFQGATEFIYDYERTLGYTK